MAQRGYRYYVVSRCVFVHTDLFIWSVRKSKMSFRLSVALVWRVVDGDVSILVYAYAEESDNTSHVSKRGRRYTCY